MLTILIAIELYNETKAEGDDVLAAKFAEILRTCFLYEVD